MLATPPAVSLAAERVGGLAFVGAGVGEEPGEVEADAAEGFEGEGAGSEDLLPVVAVAGAEDADSAPGLVDEDDLADADGAEVGFQGDNVGGAVVGGDDLDHQVGRAVGGLLLHDAHALLGDEEEVRQTAAKLVDLDGGARAEHDAEVPRPDVEVEHGPQPDFELLVFELDRWLLHRDAVDELVIIFGAELVQELVKGDGSVPDPPDRFFADLLGG